MGRIWFAAASAALAVGAFGAPAMATIVDVDYSGTVQAGQDTSGVFGAPGTDLVNQPFTADFVFNTSLGDRLTLPGELDLFTSTAPFPEGDALVSATLKIEGVTQAFNGLDESSASQFVLTDGLSSAAFDNPTGPVIFDASFLSVSATALGLPGSFDQPYAGALTPGSIPSSFQVAIDNELATGTLDATAVTISAAPEPAAWVLFFGGVGLVGLTLRRRHRSAVVGAPGPRGRAKATIPPDQAAAVAFFGA